MFLFFGFSDSQVLGFLDSRIINRMFLSCGRRVRNEQLDLSLSNAFVHACAQSGAISERVLASALIVSHVFCLCFVFLFSNILSRLFACLLACLFVCV